MSIVRGESQEPVKVSINTILDEKGVIPMYHHRLNRRDFIKTATVTAGSCVLGSIFPARVLGANDRINFGVIGVGNMGTGHLQNIVERGERDNISVVAVSDVYRRRITRAQDICGGEGYMDYRKLLDRKDVDAVLIASPDHWHAKMSIDAMEAGKHVYCEKPMTLTIEQALQVREAVRRYKKVFQVGPNDTAKDSYWKARDAIRHGRVGKVTWAQGSYNRNVRGCAFNVWMPFDETAGPSKSGEDYVDWDMWLGYKWNLAPKIRWNADHFFRFRKYWPYNGGVATDLLYHKLAPLLISIVGENGEYPHRVNANGGLYLEKDGRDIPDVFTMSVDYRSEFTVNLTSILTNDTQMPTRICGRYGTIEMDGEHAVMTGNGDYVEEFKQFNNGQASVTVPSESRRDLKGNFIDVIRQGGILHCNVDLGAATMVAIKMGVESYRRNRTMLWDPIRERIIL